jgi:flagellar capping protein FliD
MGSDLRLTGLASGFDWQPLVDRLLELESVPKQRLEAEKIDNQAKISELGVLKSRLNGLKSSAASLQNEELFNARSVGISATSSEGFTASASAGSLIGEFDVQVESLASRTEISSKNRSFGKLAGGIDLNASIRDLALFSDISTGTFTIAGKTFSITSLNATLQDVINDINTTFSSVTGVNPEKDGTGITLEYDSNTDKFYLDTNEPSVAASSNLPVLGSTTDTSNFLDAIGLLDRSFAYQDADFETGSTISIFNSGDGGKAWLHSTDQNLTSQFEDLPYAAFNGSLYLRQKLENDFQSGTNYSTGDRVYSNGFVYESTNSLSATNWDSSLSSSNDMTLFNGQFYRLLVDLETQKVDDFSSVDSGSHLVTNPVNGGPTSSADAYKAGDITKGTDGTFFRAIKDRTDNGAVNWGNYDSSSGYTSSISSQGWTGNIPGETFEGGRYYELSTGVTGTLHGGTTDTTLYKSSSGWGSSSNLVVGASGIVGAENHYFTPKTNQWDLINDHSTTNSYAANEIVRQGTDFWQANSAITPGAFSGVPDWTNVTSQINDIGNLGSGGLADSYWEKADLSLTNATYWKEIAQANDSSDFDSDFWQIIKPEMSRIDESGNGVKYSTHDYSLWAKIGNVLGSDGDSIAGNRDAAENPIPTDANFTYSAWSGTADLGDFVEHNNKIFQAASNTALEPGTIGSEGDWHIISDSATTTLSVSEQANKSRFTDTDFWAQYTVPDPDQNSGHWSKVQEKVIESSQPLGTIDMRVSLASANFAGLFQGLSSGLGNFFVGEGEGAVRIDYDVNRDSLSTLIDRVNSSKANIDLFYDPIGDRFVARSKNTGAIGITMHESDDWDTLAGSSVNIGKGNILELMGLTDPVSISNSFDSSILNTYQKGAYVSISNGNFTTYWQSLKDAPTEDPSASSEQWRQVIRGVARAMDYELGQNSSIRINNGDLIYSTESEFTGQEHGFEGISFDVAQVSIGGSASFTVSKDVNPARAAINSFVEEFNNTQEYIEGLTKVVRDGDDVSSSTFTGNTEISRLTSQLRKVMFGDATPHSESGKTTDGADLIINDNDGNNTEINNIATQLALGSSDSGYIIKVLDQASTGSTAYFLWNGTSWSTTQPAYSSLRLPDLGFDFGIGSDKIKIESSAKLLEALEETPERVMALFAEATQTAVFDDNTKKQRDFQGVTYGIEDFIDNFLSGEDGTGRKGTYQTHIDSIKAQNERIDDKVEQLERYLASREEQLSQSFMKMEEMQSKMDTQMTTLQNSLPKKSSK